MAELLALSHAPNHVPEPLTALILAGGFGTRLRPVVSDLPKCLAPIDGRPFLIHLFDQLDACGITQVVICSGYLGDVLESTIGAVYGARAMSIVYSQEPLPLGTAGAIGHARRHLASDPVLVMNGDSYVAADLSTFLAWHRDHAFASSMMLVEVRDSARFGTALLNGDGRVCAFREKTGLHQPGLVNAGIYLLSRALIEKIPSGRTLSLEREVFPAQMGWGLGGYRVAAPFLDIGTPESYAQASAFFSAQAQGGSAWERGASCS